MSKVETTKSGDQPVARQAGMLSPLIEMERWFEDFFPRRWLRSSEGLESSFPANFRSAWEGRWPKIDILDRDDSIVVKAELPGVTKDDLDVTMTNRILTISAKTESDKKEEKGDYYWREINRGEFQRTITLPAEVKSEAVKAEFNNGVLELTLPKAIPEKRQSIKIS